MSADQIKIEVDIETREAIQALAKIVGTVKEAEKETKKLTLAQAAWKAANTDLGQLTAGWRDVGEQIAKVGAVFAGLATASVMAMAAQEKEEAAIRRLGSAYEAVSAATNGAMSAQQALLLQGQLQAAGVRVNAQQLALMTRAVREYAQATGNDAAEAIEKMSNAIVNNSEDALSELNLVQARASTSAQTLANVQRELEERFRNTGPAARTLNEDLSKLPQVISYIGNAAAQAAAGGLRAFLDMLHGTGSAASYWRDIVNLPDDQRTIGRQRQTDAQRSALADRRQSTLNRLNQAGVSIPESMRGQLGYGLLNADDRELAAVDRAIAQAQRRRGAGPLRADRADVAGGFDANFNLTREISESSAQVGYSFANALRENLGIMRAQIEDEGRKRGPAVAANIRALDDNKRKLDEHAAAAHAAAVDLARAKAGLNRLKDESVDSILDYYRGSEFRRQNAFEIDADRAQSSLAAALGINATDGADFGAISDSVDGGGSAARAERSRRSRIANRDRETRRRARSESPLGQFGALFGVERDDSGNIKPLDGLQTGLNFAQQALPQLQNAFGEFWTSIASGSVTAGDAVAAFGAKTLSIVGNVAIQEGSVMMLKAIPMLIEAPPLGAAYLAGGAGLIALGVGLGAAGAAAKPQPTPSANSDSNAARGMRSASLTSGDSRLGSTTVVMASLVPTGVVDAVNARNGLRQIGRSGLDDGQRIPRRVEH